MKNRWLKLITTTVCLLAGVMYYGAGWAQYPNAEKDIIGPMKAMADSMMAAGGELYTPAQALAFTDSGRTLRQSVAAKVAGVADKPLSAKVLYEKDKSAVGLVAMCTKPNPLHGISLNQASAFVITADGVCVTNYHVIYAYAHAATNNNKGVFLVRLGNGRIYTLQSVLAVSATDDIALIRLNTGGETLPYLSLAAEDPTTGEDVFILGNPLKQLYSFTRGMVSDRYNESMLPAGGSSMVNRNLLSVTAEFAVGASGSPLLDDRGNVAGIVSSTYVIEQQNTGHPQTQMVIKNAVPVSSIKKLLKDNQD